MLHLTYQAIKKALATSVVPTPAYIDWYYGQYLTDEQEAQDTPLWDTPAVFIEFLPIQWATLGSHVQCADLYFNIHLVNESFHADAQRLTDTASLQHLQQAASIYAALMGFRCMLSYVPGMEGVANTAADMVLMETITRTASDPDHALRRHVVSVQMFRTKVFDYGATRNWQTVMATLNPTVELVDNI